jgi:hypothetical protein
LTEGFTITTITDLLFCRKTIRTYKKLLPNWPWTIYPHIGRKAIVIIDDKTNSKSYEELAKWESNDSVILVVNKVNGESEKRKLKKNLYIV